MAAAQRLEQQKKAKRAELDSNRYSQFREEFDDIFEVTLNKKLENEHRERQGTS